MKSYILTKDSVKELANAVVYQDATLHLEKRENTDFYIAITGDEIAVPLNEDILEIELNKKDAKLLNHLNLLNQKDDNFVDLTLRFKLTDDIDAKFINEKVAPAIHHSIEKVLKDKYNDENKSP